MLRAYTGENHLLSDALLAEAGRALAADDGDIYVVVPRQLTLLTERTLLQGLKLRGSFRLRVISPARLCAEIFAAAGGPGGVRVDERGRVMLIRRALRESGGLSVYKNAWRRRGFAEKCARQIETFLQGGVTVEDLRACAEASDGVQAAKLRDLAEVMAGYLALIAGRYQDGEMELVAAAARVREARFARGAHFFFFGFDIIPATLIQLIAQLSAECSDAAIFYPLINDEHARDADCCEILLRQLGGLFEKVAQAGGAYARVKLKVPVRPGAIAALSRELFACPPQSYEGAAENVSLFAARDVREECMAAAARARALAMRGMRYGDMQLICMDMDGYRQSLEEAFELYGVPLFMDRSRPVSRMAPAEYLLTALKLLEKNFRAEDMFALMRTGYTALTRDEADRMMNYAVARGIEGGRWLRPLSRGGEAEIQALEPLRARLAEPLLKLKGEMKAAKALHGQLAALFGFMEETGALEKSREMQRALTEQGLREQAGALAQAWNRIVGALDQMASLMGDGRMSLSELSATLRESLDAAIVKQLPQSGDAVYAQDARRMLMQPARALFVLGMNDQNAPDTDGLLTDAQRTAVARQAGAWLGPDARCGVQLRRFYFKSAVAMAREKLYLSCAMASADGAAQRPGMAIELASAVLPNARRMDRARLQSLLLISPGAALRGVARAFARQREGVAPETLDLRAASALRTLAGRMPELRDRLGGIARLLDGGVERERLSSDSARALYGRLRAQSVTRLEKFARCPFAYFTDYGLKPLVVEPFELDRRQAGTFLHEAVHEFLRQSGAGLNDMDADSARARMGAIADAMLRDMRPGSPMEDSFSARAEERALRETACRCAQVLCKHMQGSSFRAEYLEQDFGREDGANRLMAGDTVLEGRIDRVDRWREGNGLRVIDFKLGGRSLDLAGAYYGLALQLPVYLGAAMKKTGARSAGMYYFALDEGMVDSQSTNPVEIERERAKQFRMDGLLPRDMELISAQSPDPTGVLGARFKNGGEMYSNVPCADDHEFAHLVHHALKMARRQIDAIRGGEAAVSPVSFDGREACAWCKLRAACLFDAKLDGKRQRRMKGMKWSEALEHIVLEDGTDE